MWSVTPWILMNLRSLWNGKADITIDRTNHHLQFLAIHNLN